jgi:hypothetical protein
MYMYNVIAPGESVASYLVDSIYPSCVCHTPQTRGHTIDFQLNLEFCQNFCQVHAKGWDLVYISVSLPPAAAVCLSSPNFRGIRPLEYQLSSVLRSSFVRPAKSPSPCTALLLFGGRARGFPFGKKRRGGLPGSFCGISQHCETRSAVQAAEGHQPSAGVEVGAAGV